jgi:hypothetical protein
MNTQKCQKTENHGHYCIECEYSSCSAFNEPCNSCREEENNFKCNFIKRGKVLIDWISIKEKTPKYGECYLVYDEEFGVCRAYYYHGSCGWEGDNYAEESSYSQMYSKVTHWAPLPEQPTKKGVD